ncbi:hypothetical protein FGB62_123g012 [Gracilaria domingensis]|nr:hypothetical protein FGB62_123g012 [Gracilaria domingensis]
MVYWASVTFAHATKLDDNQFRVLLLHSALRIFRDIKDFSMHAEYVLKLLSRVLSDDLNLLHQNLTLIEEKQLMTRVGAHIPSRMHSLDDDEKRKVRKAWQLLILMQIISLGNDLELDEEDFSLISELDAAAEFPFWDLEKQFEDHGIYVQPIPKSQVPDPLSSSDSDVLTFSNQKSSLLVYFESDRLGAVGFSVLSLILVPGKSDLRVLLAVMRKIKSFQNCLLSEFTNENGLDCQPDDRRGICTDNEDPQLKSAVPSRKVFVSLEWLYELKLSHDFVAVHGTVGSAGVLLGNNVPSALQDFLRSTARQLSECFGILGGPAGASNEQLGTMNNHVRSQDHSLPVFLDGENKLVYQCPRRSFWICISSVTVQIGFFGIELQAAQRDNVRRFSLVGFQHFMTFSSPKSPGFMTRVHFLERALRERELFPRGHNQSLLRNIISEDVSSFAPCALFQDLDCRLRFRALQKGKLPFPTQQVLENDDSQAPNGSVCFQDKLFAAESSESRCTLPFRIKNTDEEEVMQICGRRGLSDIGTEEINLSTEIIFDIV